MIANKRLLEDDLTRLQQERLALIEANRTPNGGWARKTLAQWGVPWPPPKGWKERLVKRGFSKPINSYGAR